MFDATTSLWSVTATPPSPVKRMAGDTTCDVVIVGAGFTGLSAALHLAEAGASVTVIEKREIGFGASGRSGGQVNLGFKLDPDDLESYVGVEVGRRMLAEGSRVGEAVFGLIDRYGLQCDAQQKGWLKVAHCASAMRRQKRQQSQWKRRGIELAFLSGDDITRRAGAHSYVSGLYYPQGGSVQPLSYTRELARVAAEKGARIFEGTAANGLRKNGTLWKLTTDNGAIAAPCVLLCTNGYTDRLWLGLNRSVVPVRSLQMATEPLPASARAEILPTGCTLSDMRRIVYYFRLDRDNRLCFGGMGPMRDEFRDNDFIALKHAAVKIFPNLAGIRWDYHWGGRIAMTRDYLPHLHELAPGVLAGMGYNGRGVGMATIMGRVLSDAALGKDRKDLPFPVASPKAYPFHGLRNLGFKLATSWMSLRDKIDLLIG